MVTRTASQIRLDPEDFAKLKVIAESEKRSMNSKLEALVRDEIRRYERKHGAIVLPENQND